MIENLDNKEVKTLYYRSCNIDQVVLFMFIGIIITGFKAINAKSADIIFLCIAFLLLNTFVIIGLCGRHKWGRILGIVVLFISGLGLLVGFPLGAVFVIWGIFSLTKASILFGPNRLTHSALKEEFQIRKNSKKVSQREGGIAVHVSGELYRKAAVEGLAVAPSSLGNAYAKGDGVPQDDAEAVNWYRKAAEQGHAEAQFNLGLRYANGKGVLKNKTEAMEWYRKAAEQGLAKAQYNLGACHGLVDPAEAVEWFLKAAEQGLAQAQFILGVRYANGKELQQNDAAAVIWYRKAAEQGHAEAQYFLGRCYDNGEGIVKNEAEAANWYRKAGEQGHAMAQYNLGLCYGEGTGVEENETEAFNWYRKAADQGQAPAQFNLGCCYYNGQGAVKNDLLAYQWCLLASANGHEMARKNISAIEEKLTAEQRAEGQRLATEWQAAFEKRQAEAVK